MSCSLTKKTGIDWNYFRSEQVEVRKVMAKNNYEKSYRTNCRQWLEIEGQEVFGECGEERK